MKKHSSTILLVLIFFVGLSVMLYPTISDFWNEKRQSKAIVDYQSAIENMKPEDYSAIFKEAENYNKKLENINYPLINGVKVKDYDEILNVNGNGMMGYIEIPVIDVYLPIYHGVDESVLSKGVGHISKTAFPIGGEGNHSVLSGHTGLPSAELFTDLTEVKEGDEFFIHILGDTVAYEVDQILVVLPEEVDNLLPVAGEDYCTLVTCTPYGVNSHRLLVRGHRIEYTGEVEEVINAQEETLDFSEIIVICVGIALFLLVLIFIILYIMKRRKNAHENVEKNTSDT